MAVSMNAFIPASEGLEAELLALERRRCAAICANDVVTLESMMSASLTYVHMHGTVESKAEYLAGLTDLREFKSVERENLSIRTCGAVAVVTGIQKVVVRRRGGGDWRNLNVFATQVWARDGERWLMEVYHSTGLPA